MKSLSERGRAWRGMKLVAAILLVVSPAGCGGSGRADTSISDVNAMLATPELERTVEDLVYAPIAAKMKEGLRQIPLGASRDEIDAAMGSLYRDKRTVHGIGAGGYELHYLLDQRLEMVLNFDRADQFTGYARIQRPAKRLGDIKGNLGTPAGDEAGAARVYESVTPAELEVD